jgi:hypothetical protein
MNNPPAFPRPLSVDDVDPDISYPAHVGMTLRDYFAAKAMQGQLSRPSGGYLPEKEIAKVAYMQADAMLKAREA